MAPGWPDIEPVEVAGDSPQCLPLAPPLDHERQYLRLWPVGMMRGQRQRPRGLNARIALPGPSALGLGQRRLRPLGNHLALVLGDGGQNVDGQPVGLGHIASDEVRAALHQICDKSDVAGQPVKTGNQQGSAALPALLKGGKQLGPVRVPPSALDLGELGHELATVDLAGDGLTLRVKAQPARALAVGRNTVIGNEISHGSASIVAAVPRQLPFVQILNLGLDLYDKNRTMTWHKMTTNVIENTMGS